MADRPRSVVDTLLAATALVHGLALVTRNTRDVSGTGANVLNPWN
jgi:predicted nucleic acid-binding protein